jgi:hypothetical protein
MKKNVVMNHAQFMAAANAAAAKYSTKGNTAQKDEGGTKVKQDLAKVEGQGTASIQRFTKAFLAKAKSKKVVGGGKKK